MKKYVYPRTEETSVATRMMNKIIFRYFALLLLSIAGTARGSQGKELYRKEFCGGKTARVVLDSEIVRKEPQSEKAEFPGAENIVVAVTPGETETNYKMYLVDTVRESTNCVWSKQRIIIGCFGSLERIYVGKESGFIIHDVAMNNASVAVLYTNDETLYVDIISPLDETSEKTVRSIPLCSKEGIRNTTFANLVWAQEDSSCDLYILYLFDQSGRKIFHVDEQTAHLILNE